MSLLALVLVPLVFVAVGAGPLADAAQLLRGSAAPPRWKPPPPGGPPGSSSASPWTPGFRGPPRRRRLVIASLPATRLVAARLLTGLALAVLASAVAPVALTLRADIAAPARVAAGTLMFAAIFLGIGAVVGATVRKPGQRHRPGPTPLTSTRHLAPIAMASLAGCSSSSTPAPATGSSRSPICAPESGSAPG